MSEEELKSWRTIVQLLVEYGLYDLYRDEIRTVANFLKKHMDD